MEIHQEIYERLKEVARNGDLITYSEIAPLAGLDMENQADRTRMGEILGEISTFEHQNGRPMLSSLVVLAGIGYPGEGYFNLARHLGLHHGKGEFEDLDFFVQEVKRVHGYWSDKQEHQLGTA
jgi:hypothetical protein